MLKRTLICLSLLLAACGDGDTATVEAEPSSTSVADEPSSTTAQSSSTSSLITSTSTSSEQEETSTTESTTSTTATPLTSAATLTATPKASVSTSQPSPASAPDGTGYEISDIPGGKLLAVNYKSANLGTSKSRCSVASINANWMTTATKDSSNPTHLGIAVVNGAPVQSSDPQDRGVIGERISSNTNNVIDDWSKRTMVSKTPGRAGMVLENHYAWYTTDTSGFTWAVSGVPLVVNGEYDVNLSTSAQNNYTYGAGNHSFIAVNPNGTLSFGATNSMTAKALADLLVSKGNIDVMMLDGGGSTELNIGGESVVAGTSRKPIWFGLGC